MSAVHLVTFFSPCKCCSDELQSFVRKNKAVTFYIGYVERYRDEDNLNYFINQVGSEPNVKYGKITVVSWTQRVLRSKARASYWIASPREYCK